MAPLAESFDLIRTRALGKIYRPRTSEVAAEVTALRDLNLSITRGEMTAIVGASGSGKSTLLNILGCLDRPTSGEYWLAGLKVSELSGDALADIRNQMIGFVFQSFQLLPRLTALENVMVPLGYDRVGRRRDRRDTAAAALRRLGLGDRLNHRPTQLSGGQQQRVAIARALVNNPQLLLADEPTGNLDSGTAREILGVFRDVHAAGTTVLIITHSAYVAAQTQRVIEIQDGSVAGEGSAEQISVASS